MSCFLKLRYTRSDGTARKIFTSRESYVQWYSAQGDRCAICGKKRDGDGVRSLHLDHDHATMQARGLLCVWCNRGIGFFRDNPYLLRSAIEYLTKPRPHHLAEGKHPGQEPERALVAARSRRTLPRREADAAATPRGRVS